ncbi:hemin receptor [Treponema phagedenis]|uniref:Hemin-binding protein B n=1 Tax=Treponema phagedenis TaxID=162 RepID=A0A0B7GZP4_TREPH|nr:ZinT/AdcA family metal-binding protein [Treponema phagedenis]NVP24487.1 ZinT/AdcA family metal-binding protein [Treponema phagedenis]QKS92730.1 ZinT/AdcA family metal-binding protein [Treponema phagedenis]QLC58694.1 ZinT/AdcA family metal-binding protein [Treponema phagedenis]QSH99701.1 hemin receptor [Treponema phagedenis]CEM63112.1 Hemin-binding protein B [Treponema phagedenis]
MSKKRIGTLLVPVFMALAVFFTACQSAPDAESGATPKTGELAGWKGEWISFGDTKDDPSLEAAYKETAEKMPNYTVEGFKAAFAAMYKTPVVKAKFDGSNKVKFTVRDADGKEEEIACEYKYIGKIPVPGYEGSSWEAFEAVKDVRGLSQAKYMVLFPPHSHDGGMLHWHARFGARSAEAIAKDTSFWWPTFVSASMSKEDLLKEAKEGIKAMGSMFDKSPFEFYAAQGRWMNSSLIYDNTSKEVSNAFDKIIKEFAGKNPKGGDFTKADIIAEMKKAYGTTDDFSHIEFVTKKGKNELVLYKDGKEVYKAAYKRVADNPSKPGMLAVATDKGGKFKTISLTGAHGTPMHFHLWYGASDIDLTQFTTKPTCIPENTSNADIAARVEKSCRSVLNSILMK